MAAGVPMEVAAGEPFVVRLTGTPTGGYTWHFTPSGDEDQFVELAGTERLTPPGVVGGSAVQAFRFVALRPGQVRLRFEYGRPWEGAPVEEQEIPVVIADHRAAEGGGP